MAFIDAGVTGRVYNSGSHATKRFVVEGVGVPHVREVAALRLARGCRHLVQASRIQTNSDGFLEIDMELCNGTLFRRLYTSSAAEKTRWAFELICALVEMHEVARIAHRDIKLQNILVRPDGSLAVCDFGLSSPLDARGVSAEFHTRNVVSLWYRPPELLKLWPVAHRLAPIDIWSAGLVLVELLTNNLPSWLKAQTTAELKTEIDQHWKDTPREEIANMLGASAVDSSLKDLIGRMLVLDPTQRISAGDALRHSCFSSFSFVPRAATAAAPLDLALALRAGNIAKDTWNAAIADLLSKLVEEETQNFSEHAEDVFSLACEMAKRALVNLSDAPELRAILRQAMVVSIRLVWGDTVPNSLSPLPLLRALDWHVWTPTELSCWRERHSCGRRLTNEELLKIHQ